MRQNRSTRGEHVPRMSRVASSASFLRCQLRAGFRASARRRLDSNRVSEARRDSIRHWRAGSQVSLRASLLCRCLPASQQSNSAEQCRAVLRRTEQYRTEHHFWLRSRSSSSLSIRASASTRFSAIPLEAGSQSAASQAKND